ncbi:hypothetical protein M427DRAFT_73674 [Gonapodya prolifera JEL478]|uniref:Integrase zinc-binding domain-containing protein n=1 Tax=Gonapodya prolifera (strain JEL478) TaxID=1344416 RepID=A0A139A2H3_GONPJ|nr:hypothetical protein M427DRAFT_73674 [Gonapodya prolifera JEL478]|eukprot:KXS10745.1 hypothetical protein M427DRAFT_73674 [Gonapodya prolifera JEL478]
MTIQHRPGRIHLLPDFLSRHPTDTASSDTGSEPQPHDTNFPWPVDHSPAPPSPFPTPPTTPLNIAAISDITSSTSAPTDTPTPPAPPLTSSAASDTTPSPLNPLTLTPATLLDLQLSDPSFCSTSFLPTLRSNLSTFTILPTTNLLQHTLVPLQPGRRPDPIIQLALPQSLAPDVLRALHDNLTGGAHLGRNRTFEAVRHRFWWLDMASNPPGLLIPKDIPSPNHTLGIDLLGPFRRSRHGNKYIVVVTDDGDNQAPPNNFSATKELIYFIDWSPTLPLPSTPYASVPLPTTPKPTPSPNASTPPSRLSLLLTSTTLSPLPPLHDFTKSTDLRSHILSTLNSAYQRIRCNIARQQLYQKTLYNLRHHPVSYSLGQRVLVYVPRIEPGSNKVKVVTHVQRLKPYFSINDSYHASRNLHLPLPSADLDDADPALPPHVDEVEHLAYGPNDTPPSPTLPSDPTPPPSVASLPPTHHSNVSLSARSYDHQHDEHQPPPSPHSNLPPSPPIVAEPTYTTHCNVDTILARQFCYGKPFFKVQHHDRARPTWIPTPR